MADIVINWPKEPYEPNINCKFHLLANGANSYVDLKWIYFDMEPAINGVCRDWVQVWKKDPDTKELVSVTSQLCGNELPTNETKRVQELLVHVRTSSIQSTHTGFELMFKKYVKTSGSIGDNTRINDNSGMHITPLFRM